MKTFRFTLEAVRTLRQRQENDAMEEYARTLLLRQQALDQLEAVQQRISAGWHELRVRLAAGCTASEAAQAHGYHRSLEKRREECATALGLAERRVNAAMQTMLFNRQQREIIDKLFEKQKIGHAKEEARNEQKFLDDLASRRGTSIHSWNPAEATS